MDRNYTENKKLLEKIRALSFAKAEAELFLDTHPDSKEALSFYKDICSELSDAITKYQNEVAPIYAEGVLGDDGWTWVKGKWPWHLDEDMTEDG